MQLELSAEQKLLTNSVHDCAAGFTAEMSFNDKWKRLADIGFFGLATGEYDNTGKPSAVNLIVALNTLAYSQPDNGFSFSVAAHTLACLVPVAIHANDQQKAEFMSAMTSGKAVAANAMTESESGSEVFKLRCKAAKNSNGYVLNGIKTFISNIGEASVVLAYCSTDESKGFFGGITAFLLKEGEFSRGAEFKKMGLNGCSLGEVVFDNVKLGEDRILGKPGGGGIIFNESMTWERICLTGIHLGSMKRVMEKTLDFVRNRSSMGQSIGKFQGVSHKIAEMEVLYRVARSFAFETAVNLDSGRNLIRDAAISKLFVSNAVKEFMLLALQVFGGYGYIAEYGIESEVRDAMASTIYSGTSEIQKNIIASDLGL